MRIPEHELINATDTGKLILGTYRYLYYYCQQHNELEKKKVQERRNYRNG